MSLPAPEDLRFTCRRIFIRNLCINCRIGAYDHERLASQPVIINCDLWVRLEDSTSRRDALADVLNYDEAVSILRDFADAGHVDLQETLVERMLDALCRLPGVVLARISTEKPEAYPDVDAVGIESWRATNPLP